MKQKKKSMFESPRRQTTALCELSSSANLSFHRYCCYCHCCMRTEWSPRNRIKKKRDALHLMRTFPRELDWSPMILNGNDRCVMGDNNSVELRWGTPAKMLQLRPGRRISLLLIGNSALSGNTLIKQILQCHVWGKGTRHENINTSLKQRDSSEKRKVGNCPLFSADSMTRNISWQVSPSRCSREKEKGKITRCVPGEISFLTSEWLDQFFSRRVSQAGCGGELPQRGSDMKHWRIGVVRENRVRMVGCDSGMSWSVKKQKGRAAAKENWSKSNHLQPDGKRMC